MEILRKAAMPDGTAIQVEKWTDGYAIGAYPVAKNTGKYGWVRKGDIFRLTIKCDDPYMFAKLIKGEKTLEDFSDLYWNGKKDRFYMGMEDEEE